MTITVSNHLTELAKIVFHLGLIIHVNVFVPQEKQRALESINCDTCMVAHDAQFATKEIAA